MIDRLVGELNISRETFTRRIEQLYGTADPTQLGKVELQDLVRRLIGALHRPKERGSGTSSHSVAGLGQGEASGVAAGVRSGRFPRLLAVAGEAPA